MAPPNRKRSILAMAVQDAIVFKSFGWFLARLVHDSLHSLPSTVDFSVTFLTDCKCQVFQGGATVASQEVGRPNTYLVIHGLHCRTWIITPKWIKGIVSSYKRLITLRVPMHWMKFWA